MKPLKLILGLTVALLGGCIIVDDRPRHVYSAPPPEPMPGATVVVGADDETHYVVYREYFGCSEEEIAVLPHYRRYYGCSDDDFYFCFFVSRRMGLSFDVCFRSYYYDCGRSCDRLILYYRVPREHFFVTVGVGAAYPPIYARPYSCYHSGTYASVTFTNQEYVALVHMRVGVEYQGCSSTTYFSRVNECGGNTNRVIVQHRDDCGRGRTTVTGATVQKTAPRPWTMPPEQKHSWQQAHQAQVTKCETPFKEAHKEQVQKAPHQPPQNPPGQHPAAKPGNPPPHAPAAERTPPGHEESGRPKGSPNSEGAPKSNPPERSPKPPDHREEAPPQKAPPPREKGGKEEHKGDQDKDKDKKKDNRADRSRQDRRPG